MITYDVPRNYSYRYLSRGIAYEQYHGCVRVGTIRGGFWYSTTGELLLGVGALTHMLTPPLPPVFVCGFSGQRSKLILNYLLHMRVAVPSSQSSVTVGSVSTHRIAAQFKGINELNVRASSLIMPRGGFPVDRTSTMDDLASLSRQLAQDRNETDDRRENDRQLRRHNDERLRTQSLEQMDQRYAAFREVASGVTVVSGSEPLPVMGK